MSLHELVNAKLELERCRKLLDVAIKWLRICKIVIVILLLLNIILIIGLAE